jgi:hypothetical protein
LTALVRGELQTFDDAGDALPEQCTASLIWGLASVKVARMYHEMAALTRHEHEQVDYWENLLGTSLHCNAFIFEVVHVSRLPEPQSLQQYSGTHFKGSVVEMEDGQRRYY